MALAETEVVGVFEGVFLELQGLLGEGGDALGVARLVASGPDEGVFHAGDELVLETGPEGGVMVGDGVKGGGGAEQT